MSLTTLEATKIKANVVPMHIKYNGSADTENYFSLSKKTLPDNQQIAYFRGCKLVGKDVILPENMSAYVCNKAEVMIDAPETPQGYAMANNYVAEGSFRSFIVYGHESEPEPTSQWFQLNEWAAISDIIHGE